MTGQLKGGDSLGRYHIERLLGSGAMGDVYLARDPRIERLLAIKTVRIASSSPEDITERKERLLREAKAAGRLIHPNVVTLFDTGEDRGLVFLAFEFVDGSDLLERLSAQPPLSLAQALRIVRQTASALEAAHAQGVIHRDIKPSNILVTRQGEAKIADFGIAKLAGQSTELTTAGAVIGSPQYMSPEQIRGEALDGRTDLFSLGSVLYEVLTGKRAFPGDTITTLVYQILNEDPQDLAELRPDLPLPVVRLVRRMMSKDRATRAQSAGEVVSEIDQIEAQLSELEAGMDATVAMPASGPSVLPPPPPPAMPSASATVGPKPEGTAPSPSSERSSRSRSAVPLVLAVLLVLLVVTGFVGVMLLRSWFSSTSSPDEITEAAEPGPSPAESVEEAAPDRVAREADLSVSPSGPEAKPVDIPPVTTRAVEASAEQRTGRQPDAGTDTARAASPRVAEPRTEPPSRPIEAPSDPEPPAASRSTVSSSAAAGTPPSVARDEPSNAAGETATPPPESTASPSLPEDRVSAARDSSSVTINARRSTGLALTFDVEPEGAFVLFRAPEHSRFTSIGRASEYDGRKNQRFTLPEAGTYLVMLRAEDYGDYVIEIEASAGGSTEPLRARLAAPGVQIATARSGDRFRVSEAIAFVDPPARAQVLVDGQSRGRLRDFDGSPGKWLRLSPGEHRISIEGRQNDLTFIVEMNPGAAVPRLLLTAGNP